MIGSLRKLVLGETWTLPLGVALTLLVALALDAAGPGWWSRAGGFVVLGGAVLALLVSLRYPGGRVRSGGGSTSGPASGAPRGAFPARTSGSGTR